MRMVSIAHSGYKRVFSEAKEILAGVGVAWLDILRNQAMERFVRKGFPTNHAEEWRYTANRLSELSTTPFVPVAVDANETKAKISTQGLEDTYRLVFINGHFYPVLSDVEGLPTGVSLKALADSLDSDLVQETLSAETPFNHSIFVSLNTAFMNGGVILHIAKGIQLAKPIEIMNITRGVAKGSAIHTRNIIVLEDGAQATLLEYYHSEEANSYWTNAVTHIKLGRDAILDHYKIQDENKESFHLAEVDTLFSDHSNYHNFTLSVGAKVARNEVRADLKGKKGECCYRGITLARGKQHMDNFLPVSHTAPNNRSSQTYKSVLDDEARGTFYGKITVPLHASKTEARQLNRNLLLSEKAQSNSRPELEILTDDVQCSHGSSTGQLDDNALFYLRARGIPEDEAKNILVQGFIQELLDEINNADIKVKMEQVVAGWLKGRE